MSGGILGGPVDPAARLASSYPACEAREGMHVVHRASGFAGALVAFDGTNVVVRGATGLERSFRNEPGGFLVDANAVRLVAPTAARETVRVSRTERTASGAARSSVRRRASRARAASSSRACTTRNSSSGCGAT